MVSCSLFLFPLLYRHMRDAPTAQFIDRYLTRPTPHVLKSGASANADVLRIQLTKAQDIIHQLDEKVAEGYVPLVVVLTCVNVDTCYLLICWCWSFLLLHPHSPTLQTHL